MISTEVCGHPGPKFTTPSTCNSYAMGCPPVRGDIPRALAQVDSPWYNYFIPPASISVDLAQHEIFRAKVGKIGIKPNETQREYMTARPPFAITDRTRQSGNPQILNLWNKRSKIAFCIPVPGIVLNKNLSQVSGFASSVEKQKSA